MAVTADDILLRVNAGVSGAQDVQNLGRHIGQLTGQLRATGENSQQTRARMEQLRDALLRASQGFAAGSREAQRLAQQAAQVQSQLNSMTRAADAAARAAAQQAAGQAQANSLTGRVGGIARDAAAGLGTLRAGLLAVVGPQIIGGLQQLAQGIKGLADEANKADTTLRVFELTTRRFNVGLDSANAVAERLSQRFGASMTSIRESMTTLIRAGFRDMGQLERVMTGAAASAIAFGRSAEDGFGRVGDAAVTGLSAALNGIGIAENLGPAMDKYARSLGKTADELNEVERAQVVANLVLKATATEVEALDSVLNEYTRAQQENKRAVTEAREELGRELMPVVTAFTREMTRAITGTMEWARANKGTLVPALKDAAVFIVDAGNALKVLLAFIADLGVAVGGVATVLTGFGLALTGGFVGGIRAAITEVTNLFGIARDGVGALSAAWDKFKAGDFKGAAGVIADWDRRKDAAVAGVSGNIVNGIRQGAQFGVEAVYAGQDSLNSVGSRTDSAIQNGTLSGNNVRADLKVGEQEAGRFAYNYISTLADVFKRDSRVKSDCAIIAYEILNQLGAQVKGTAQQNAWVPTLEKNAQASGFTQTQKAQAGDLVIFKTGNGRSYGAGSGMHAGVVAGYEDGKLMVIDNPGTQRNGRDGITRVRPIGPDMANATFYRAPNSPYQDGSTPKPGPGIDPAAKPGAEKSDAALIAEARRILDRLESAQKTGNLTGAAEAKGTLETFTKSSDRAAAAVEYVRSKLKEADKDVGKFGQGFDRLKGQLDSAGALFKLNDNAQAYIKSLDGISKGALEAAEAEKKRFGETDKFRALQDLAGDAAGRARSEREKIQRAEEQADKEDARRAKEQAQLRARIADERRQLTVSAAQAELERTQELSRQELEGFKGIAAQRLVIVKRQAEDEYQARLAVARATREKELRESANAGGPNQVERDRQIRGQYDAAELAARGARDAARQKALDGLEQENEAVAELTDRYRQAREELNKRAEAGTLTADDLAEYARTLAGYWADAGKAGLKARPEIAAAHAAAKQFAGTAVDLNGAAVQFAQNGAEAIADGSSEARKSLQDTGVTLEHLLTLLPEGVEETAAFVEVMQELDRSGKLAKDSLKGLLQVIADREALREGVRAGSDALDDVLAAPGAYGDNGRDVQAGQVAAQRGQRETAENLLQTLLGLDDAALGNAETMQFYADMLDNAAQAGGITTEQLKELKRTLDTLRGNPGEDFGEYLSIRDGGGKPLDPNYQPPGTGPGPEARQAEADRLRGMILATQEFSPAVVDAWKASLEGAAQSGAITAAQLKDLLWVLENLADLPPLNIPLDDDEVRFERVAGQVDSLVASLNAGEISLDEFGQQAGPLTVQMERMGLAAERAGNPALAAQYRDLAVALRNLGPVLDSTVQKLSKLEKFNLYAGYVQQLAGAFGQLAEAAGGTDLAANLNGIANAAGKAISIASAFASGNIVGGIAGIVSALADAIGGFRRAREEARKAREEFEGSFKLIDASTFSSFTTRSRGFFADLFGGGPEVVKKINESAAGIARTIEQGVLGGFQNGIKAFLNGMGDMLSAVREGVRNAIIDAITQAVVQGAIIKGALGNLLTQLTNGLAAGQDVTGIIAQIGQALPAVVNSLTSALTPLKSAIDSALPSSNASGSSTSGGFGSGSGGTFQAGTPAVVVDVLGQTRDLLRGANDASRLMVDAARLMGGHVDRFGKYVDRLHGPHNSATAGAR